MTPTMTETRTPVLTIRQSHLTWLLGYCPRGAYALAIEGREGPSYSGAARGTCIHEAFARYNLHLWKKGRQTDWEAAERIGLDVLADCPELPLSERDDVIAQVRNIAQSYLFEASHFYGAEEQLYTDLELADGRVVRITGRLDLLLVDQDEGLATIRDVKGNHSLPTDSAIAKDLQLTIYAMLVFDNLPDVERVSGQLWFTRYGLLLPRKEPAVWTREDIDVFKDHLRVILAHFLDSKTHEAVPGVKCQYCPLRRVNECRLYRSYYGTVPPPPRNETQALKLARQIVALEDARETRIALLKDYVNEHGPLALGSGSAAETFAYHKRESEEIAPSDLLAVLEDNRSLVGDQPIDELLSVNKRSKAFRNLRYHQELRAAFDDVATTKVSTTFGHRSVGDE